MLQGIVRSQCRGRSECRAWSRRGQGRWRHVEILKAAVINLEVILACLVMMKEASVVRAWHLGDLDSPTYLHRDKQAVSHMTQRRNTPSQSHLCQFQRKQGKQNRKSIFSFGNLSICACVAAIGRPEQRLLLALVGWQDLHPLYRGAYRRSNTL